MRDNKMRSLKLSNLQIVAMGYFLVAMVGTILLLLPIASVNGETTIQQALFTAVSASCVTGLVLVDTSMHWSFFGQVVILILIQIGGMGVMTIGVRFMISIRHKVSLRDREVMVESIQANKLGGIVKLTRKIVRWTLLVETIGAILLSIRFIPEFGVRKGIFYSIFHSVSAFCNAGFDLMGFKGEYSSLVWYADDALITLTICGLITVGGIGFLVWEDFNQHKLHFKKYSLHAKVVLSVSTILSIGGAILFFFLEKENLGDISLTERILTSLFQSVSCRTAGFNTIDIANLSQGGILLSLVLMFIGGSPGSTAGGIKTTTIAVLVLYTITSIRGGKKPNIFGRSLETEALYKAVPIIMINLGFIMVGTLAICSIQPLPLTSVAFEVFSAMGTVGLTMGITRDLIPASTSIITFLMFCGRVGSVF